MAVSKRVRRPHERIVTSVRNQSARLSPKKPCAIVIHSTESRNLPGTKDLEAVIAWFDNPASQASAHVIVDSTGRSAQCVPDERKAWTCAAFNSQTLNLEIIGFATQSRADWMAQDPMLRKVAQYLAWWSLKFSIPMQRGAVNGTNVSKAGVLMHSELGRAGGGHHDPGPGFPIVDLVKRAKRLSETGWS